MLALADAATDRRAQNFKRFFEDAGWEVELLAPKTNAKRGPMRFFEYHRKLWRAMQSRSADAMLACDLYSLSAARRMRLRGRAQLLIYDAREVYTELPTVARKPLAKMFWKRAERQGLAAADLMLSTGPRDVQAICDVHHFIPRPVLVRNLPWRSPDLAPEKNLLVQHGVPAGATVLAYVGGVQEGRGLERLFRVLPTLSSKGVHVLLIGDGVLRSHLEAVVSELGLTSTVHFAGARPSDEALRMAAACDAGISLIEPISRSYELALPSKLFEYMMCGIPVVSSRLEQVTDLFASEDWISYADVNDPNSIRQGIESAIANAKNPALRDRERSLALSEYHFEHDAGKLLALIDRYIRDHHH